MELEDLGPAERIVAGAVGEPGRRRFYLQVVAGGTPVSLLAEKEQVAALARQGLAILDSRGIEAEEAAVQRILGAGLEIVDPGEGAERFRVGEISIGLGSSDLLTVQIDAIDGSDGIEFVIAPEQFRAMATAALQAVERGRPTCPWCQLPMDPDGHRCPARNGHHRD